MNTVIKLMGFDSSANVAAANARAPKLRSEADTMLLIRINNKKVVEKSIEAYKKMVTDTFLDCESKKVKISKRVAKVPKYARSVAKGRAMSTVGDSYMKGGVRSRGHNFADKVAK